LLQDQAANDCWQVARKQEQGTFSDKNSDNNRLNSSADGDESDLRFEVNVLQGALINNVMDIWGSKAVGHLVIFVKNSCLCHKFNVFIESQDGL
jgi:hypothetical protein